VKLDIASAAGNIFGYLWADELPSSFDGPAWARALCPRGSAFGLDGLFLLERPQGGIWRMEHWDLDGAHTFCSNGTRAALAVDGAPREVSLETLSSGESVLLRRDGTGIGLRMPEGEGTGLRPVPMPVWGALGGRPATLGLVGNPQLVVEVPSVAEVDLAAFAPPLRHHIAFKSGTNVNVLEVMGEREARIRSWERGVEGETLCCGTGCAVAGAWLAHRTGRPKWSLITASGQAVSVELEPLPGGQWRDLWLSGPVRRIGEATPDAGILRP
jgi:diaminopimelate epimerase